MPGEVLTQRPARGVLRNVETGRALSFQYNPLEMREKVEPVYTDLPILGLSHEIDQYAYTKSLEVGPFTLAFDAMGQDGAQVFESRNFLHSLCYAREGARDVVGGGPPRVLLVWPGLYSLVCRVRSLEITHSAFSMNLNTKQFAATIALKETRRATLTSEMVLSYGTQRGQ
jgi:hypothetical protein